ncbi:MAG: ferredoxin [Chloroflexi bacterium]|nr:ferredoxin [Chloroflexota bacterium]
MKVRVDRNLCTGVGNCAAIAPTVFELDDENKAVVLDPGSVEEDVLWEAAESCPQDAIFLMDDEGTPLYP